MSCYGSSNDDNAISTCAVVLNTKKVPYNSNSNTCNTRTNSSNTPVATTEGSKNEAHIIIQAFND